MTLATRLITTCVLSVVATALIIAIPGYRIVESALVSRELDGMALQTRQAANGLDVYVGRLRDDVSVLASSVATQAIIRAQANGGIDPVSDDSEAVWRDRLVERFRAELAVKSEYVQARLIGLADNGREIVRVDRSGPGGGIRVIPDDELQQKGARDYFLRTIALESGQADISPIELNIENGEIQEPHLPVLRAATPVFFPDGTLFGIVIINMDMSPALDRLRDAAGPGGLTYAINADGGIIVHPDRALEFGFQLGGARTLAEADPVLADAVAAAAAGPVTAQDDGQDFGVAAASTRLAGGTPVTVIEALPYDVLLAPARDVMQSALVGTVVALVAALALALVVAATLSRPLVQITRVAEAVDRRKTADLPVGASGEVGALARAFKRFVESERWLTSAFASSDNAIIICDLAGKVVRWNDAAASLFGVSVQAALDAAAAPLLAGVRDFDLPEVIARVRHQSTVSAIETVLEPEDRPARQILIYASPVHDEEQQPVGVSLIIRDVTQVRQAEELFRLAVEASPAGLLLVDSDGSILLANGEAVRLFGYSRQELVGMSVEALVPDDPQFDHRSHREAYAKHPSSRRMGAGRELSALRKDGSRFAAEIALSPMTTARGNIVLAAVLDLTEQHRAQERQRLLSSIVTSSDDAIFSLDQAGVITSWNQGAESMLGYAADDVIGQTVTLLSRPGLAHEMDAFIRRVMQGETIRSVDVALSHADGPRVDVSLNMSPIRSNADSIIGISVICHDITVRKSVETNLELRTAELQRSNAELEQFAYVASHDLQEPLRMVSSFCDLLEQRYGDKIDETGKEFIHYAVDGAQRMRRLIEDLLAYSRFNTRQVPYGAVFAQSACETAIEILRQAVTDAGAKINVEALPTVVGNESRLVQLFQNLIGNALKFRSDQPPLIDIMAKRIGGDMYEFRVRDNGIGIAADQFERIFGVFQRLHTKEAYPGTGIGLAVARRIVEQHGGQIRVESEFGQGATFIFTLPAAQGKAVQNGE